ncbi:hypothetical protein RUMHYD_01817 [Blautia hydrogenotrophica DSM 10507]|uniref:Uncharacterized protein n=1 Tax=Blautia hydrogenotrophica (strain DSM 10507 / JCM 14656 / S5a33) TaxID=476272 RepID=C0CLU4_BLAHS|nr:hypothetical protein RUMHYD_01817 [Blautia hydrogenotrophica DSM 10507]
MRSFTAKRCCGGALSGVRPIKIEGKWGLPTLFFIEFNLYF